MNKEEMLALWAEVKKYRRFNKLEYAQPYPYQLRFMEAGATYKQRYNRSGNR